MRRVLLTLVFGLLFGTCLLIYNTVAETRVDGVLIVGDADTVDGIEGGALVQTSRTVIAGTGMTGGGALDGDVTLTLDTTGDWTGTFDGLEGPTVITNIESVVLSNAFEIIRIADNRYIIHVETNASMVGQSVQDIRAKVDLGGAAQSMTDSTDEPLTFSNEVYDVGGGWDSDTHQYDVPVNGDYSVYVQAFWQGSLTLVNYVIRIKTNNNTTVAQWQTTAPSASPISVSVYQELTLTTNHFVEITAQGNGATDNINGDGVLTFVVIRLLRED